MSAINPSGQTNKYQFNLQNNETICPIQRIEIETSRVDTLKNRVHLRFHEHFQRHSWLFSVREYVTSTLGSKVSVIPTLPAKYLPLMTGCKDGAKPYLEPLCVAVLPSDAREVIDNLLSHGAMSASNRADVEDILKELEANMEYLKDLDEAAAYINSL